MWNGSEKKSLNGIWEFALASGKGEMPVFHEICVVPDCFDRDGKNFGKKGIGWYRRTVRTGGMVRLIFEGTGLKSECFWDGRKIGENNLPWSPAEYVFDAGEEGEHELLVSVGNIPSGAASDVFKGFYDFYGYGGIYRDVFIEKLDKDSVDYLAVLPLDFRTGEVKIIVESRAKTLRMSFDGGPETILPNTGVFVRTVPGFRVWSPESPHLHTLRVNGKSVSFGIRTLDWSGTDLLLNGKKLKLIGFNRHESHPEFGAATPDNLTFSDLKAIRDAGCNFIRGAHYPQKEILFDLCDRMGLLVWEEALGWGNGRTELSDRTFADSQSEQCRRMVRKSINHPSLILHGFLNEAETDAPESRVLVGRLASEIRALDPTRPVTFASNHWKSDLCLDLVDVISLNLYPGWYDGTETEASGIGKIRPVLEECAAHFPRKPLIVSEIGAAAIPGDHSGMRWSEEYQAEYVSEVLGSVFDNDRFTGVALWQFCNSKTYIDTAGSFLRPRGYNNKGCLDEYRRPKAAWKSVERFNGIK